MWLVIVNKETRINVTVPRAMIGPQLRRLMSSILGILPDLFSLMGVMEITNLKLISQGVKDGDQISVVLKADFNGQTIVPMTRKLSALLLQHLVQSIHQSHQRNYRNYLGTHAAHLLRRYRTREQAECVRLELFHHVAPRNPREFDAFGQP
jgi:hypothetical protein